VHVTGRVPERVAASLRESFTVVAEPQSADGILALLTTSVDDDYLAKAGPQLKVVANYGVGVDNIDLAAARSRNVLVANTPDVLTESTAELALTLTLALLRRVAEGDRFLRSRRTWAFDLEFMLGEGLRGKQFGVIGAGRIGRATAKLAEAHGAHALYLGRGGDLEALLATADIVSLHCPLTPETRHLIDAAALEQMKPTAVLVNTARGAIVDERALVAALESGSIAGAALDVYEHEPVVTEELLAFENVVLTPHLGSATRATREAMGLLAVHALTEVLLHGRVPANIVGGAARD
jgi:lactate dehydrogenase-like 2-hydroxyacid dehydrogenase